MHKIHDSHSYNNENKAVKLNGVSLESSKTYCDTRTYWSRKISCTKFLTLTCTFNV